MVPQKLQSTWVRPAAAVTVLAVLAAGTTLASLGGDDTETRSPAASRPGTATERVEEQAPLSAHVDTMSANTRTTRGLVPVTTADHPVTSSTIEPSTADASEEADAGAASDTGVGGGAEPETTDAPSGEVYTVYRLDHHPVPGPGPDEIELTDPVPGSEAEIVRHDDRAEFTLTTTELEKHAYTVWMVVYNVPALCTDPDTGRDRDFRCGRGDFLNPATGFSIMYGAGQEVEVAHDEFDTFSGTRQRLDRDGVIVGPGLVDPQGAEIHFLVRDHGPCPADGCGNRTTTVDGGCDNPHFGGLLWPLFGDPGEGGYECTEVQGTGY